MALLTFLSKMSINQSPLFIIDYWFIYTHQYINQSQFDYRRNEIKHNFNNSDICSEAHDSTNWQNYLKTFLTGSDYGIVIISQASVV